MDSTFLGQGSYGCVYKKKLRCTKDNKKTKHTNNTHLSKIYMNEKYATREIEIGKCITKIPNYEHYFSPVLENCNASLAQISDEDIDKCNLPLINQQTYFTTTTKYIKGQTLNVYLKEYKKAQAHAQAQASTNHTLDNKIFYIYTCLTKSIELLNKHKITHFDLSERNIIMDTTDRPIIIDYGMSIKTDTIKTEEQFKDEFGYYEINNSNNNLELYEPWCIEIILLVHLNQMQINTSLNKDHIKRLKSLSDTYINLLKMESLHFTQDEIAKYKESKHDLCEKFEGITTYEASKELMKTSAHWDQYALAIICLKHLPLDYVPRVLRTPSKRQQMIEIIKKEILEDIIVG